MKEDKSAAHQIIALLLNATFIVEEIKELQGKPGVFFQNVLEFSRFVFKYLNQDFFADCGGELVALKIFKTCVSVFQTNVERDDLEY